MSLYRWISVIVPPVAFAALGVASRLTFRMTETRMQMVCFVVLAGVLELGLSMTGRPVSGRRFFACACAGVFAILMARLHLEGPPHDLMAFLADRKS